MPRNPGPKRTKQERERDLVLIADLYLRGYTQHLITEKINAQYIDAETKEATKQISRRQIRYDLAALHKQWLDSQLIDINEAKSRELSRIDRLEMTAWDAWERSQQPTETVIEEMSSRGGHNAKMRRETRGIKNNELTKDGKPINPTEQLGDPRFLAIVNQCIDKRIRIFGLQAPTRQEHTGKDGTPIIVTIGGQNDV